MLACQEAQTHGNEACPSRGIKRSQMGAPWASAEVRQPVGKRAVWNRRRHMVPRGKSAKCGTELGTKGTSRITRNGAGLPGVKASSGELAKAPNVAPWDTKKPQESGHSHWGFRFIWLLNLGSNQGPTD